VIPLPTVGILPTVKLTRPVLVNGILGGVIVLALVGGGLWLWHPWSASAAEGVGTQLTSTVQQGSVSQTVTASGAVDPTREVSASFQVSGTVASVDVAVGQTVTAGQQLATIDATDLKQTASEDYTAWVHAKQDLAAAQSSAATASAQGGGGNQTSQINSAEDAVTKAADAYQDAEAAVANATLTAPIAGLVVAVNGQVGGSSGGTSAASSGSGSGGTGAGTGASSSSSGSGSGFVTIADTSAYVVTANIAEADIADVTVGQAATVTFPALTGTTATAKVTAISPTATSSNSVVTYATTITLDKLPDKVRLGQTAQVAITVAASKADALYVPAAAITTANGTSTVKVVDPKTGKTTAVDVTTGVVGDQGTEITKGLSAGETVVIGTVSPSTDGTGTGIGGPGTTGTRGGFGGAGGFGGGAGGLGGGKGGFGGGFGGGTGGNVRAPGGDR
jgi:macrolide-specific efflux system membrane fusion protein